MNPTILMSLLSVLAFATVGCIGMASAPMLPAPGASRESNQSPYWQAGQIVLGANASVPFQINVYNHNFKGLLLTATLTGVFSTMISANQRNLMGAPVHSGNMWGTGQLPFQLAIPISAPLGSTINITLTDLTGQQNTVNWAIHGYEFD